MDSDLKLIRILSLLVVILGIVFTLRITVFKDAGLSSPNTNLATTNTVVSETDIDSISTINTYSNITTSNDSDITNELLEREEHIERAKKVSKELQNYEKKEQVKNGILSLIIALLILSALYYIFKKYNFTTGLIAYSTYAIISSCIQNGFRFSYIFLAFIVALIETTISYIVYTKSNSFRSFLGKLLLVGVVIFVVLVILGTIIAMINGNNGILSNAK